MAERTDGTGAQRTMIAKLQSSNARAGRFRGHHQERCGERPYRVETPAVWLRKKNNIGTLWKASLPGKRNSGIPFQASSNLGTRHSAAFTLVELLVVIAIIAGLASLIIPVTAAMNRAKKRDRAKMELEQVVAAIENYRAGLNFYPPASTNYNINPLYYELQG